MNPEDITEIGTVIIDNSKIELCAINLINPDMQVLFYNLRSPWHKIISNS